MDKVDRTVHSNPQSKRRTATLYVGNIEYTTGKQDLREALESISNLQKDSGRQDYNSKSEQSIIVRIHRDVMGPKSFGEGI